MARGGEAALWSPQVTPFTLRCPFPPSAVELWAARGGFEHSPHCISTRTATAEGLRISQGRFQPKKKKKRKVILSKAPSATVSGEAHGIVSQWKERFMFPCEDTLHGLSSDRQGAGRNFILVPVRPQNVVLLNADILH